MYAEPSDIIPSTSHFSKRNVDADATIQNTNLLQIKACDNAKNSKSYLGCSLSASITIPLIHFSGGMSKAKHALSLGQALFTQRQRLVVFALVEE